MSDYSSADDTIRRPLPDASNGSRESLLPPHATNAEQESDFDDDFSSSATPWYAQAPTASDGDDDILDLAPGSADTLDSQPVSDIDRALELAAVNPLAAAAAPLLWLAGRLNESPPPDDVDQFRERILRELKRFETAAMARDVPPRLVRMGRYALAATIDDIVLNTDWGGHIAWANRSLVSQLYNETWGGERFYDLLEQMRLNPEKNIDGLEFMAVCLALGFTGKYRVLEDGRTQLSRLRYALYRTIREVRGAYDRDLSPPWPTASAPHAAPKSMTSTWLIVAVVALLLAALWIATSINLRQRIGAITSRIDALIPHQTLVVAQPVLPPVTPPPIVRVRQFLAPEIAADQVTVNAANDQIVIRLPKTSFSSGNLALRASTQPLLARIGAAVNDVQGPIRLIGYTDNIPVAAHSPLSDNVTVSLKRAQSMASVLRQYVDEPSRITAEGHGARDPIASNDTAAGRSRNRRVEIWVAAE